LSRYFQLLPAGTSVTCPKDCIENKNRKIV
jgi:hypothetical protein